MTAEIRNAFSEAFRYMRPLQKPMAKLLYHKTAGGSGLRNLVAAAGSMIITRRKFDATAEKNALTKPVEPSERLESKREERYSLFSYDIFALKKRPENKPVRKMNMNISPSFFISISPFSQ